MAYDRGAKVCRRCKAEKPIANFTLMNPWNPADYSRLSVCYYCEQKIRQIIKAQKRQKLREEKCSDPKYAAKTLKAIQYANAYRARKMNAHPKWADNDKILKIYEEALWLTMQTGKEYHVDHIIPLKHDQVCGLHVHQNLRIITAFENVSKGNRYHIL